MVLNKESPRFIPMWIELYDVPLEYWSWEGLSYLASVVGKPLGMDRLIEETCRHGIGHIAFARVLVEVEADRKLPKEILVELSLEEKCGFIKVEPNDESKEINELNSTLMDNKGLQANNRKGKGKQYFPKMNPRGNKVKSPAVRDIPHDRSHVVLVGNSFQCLSSVGANRKALMWTQIMSQLWVLFRMGVMFWTFLGRVSYRGGVGNPLKTISPHV
ncbi:hypothetical protein Pint_33495 [Pistacia integerrima]|uniref:Uncharacterized protein n=1 Tax=Pistacia integerrima TaxID=434235 RepID=A0ACC0X7A3_9ROSI|nr:hypothetical protein Pint_33495 [Pistacia integerrima]